MRMCQAAPETRTQAGRHAGAQACRRAGLQACRHAGAQGNSGSLSARVHRCTHLVVDGRDGAFTSTQTSHPCEDMLRSVGGHMPSCEAAPPSGASARVGMRAMRACLHGCIRTKQEALERQRKTTETRCVRVYDTRLVFVGHKGGPCL